MSFICYAGTISSLSERINKIGCFTKTILVIEGQKFLCKKDTGFRKGKRAPIISFIFVNVFSSTKPVIYLR